MKGYVYLIFDNNTGLCKIGMTKNEPYKRVKQLQTGNSTVLTLLKSVETAYPFKLETLMHCNFKDKKINGEWYELSEDDIKGFETTCSQKINLIEALKDNHFFAKNGLK